MRQKKMKSLNEEDEAKLQKLLFSQPEQSTDEQIGEALSELLESLMNLKQQFLDYYNPPSKEENRFWNEHEHSSYLHAVLYSSDLKYIATHIQSKTEAQVRTHHEKFVQKYIPTPVEAEMFPNSYKYDGIPLFLGKLLLKKEERADVSCQSLIFDGIDYLEERIPYCGYFHQTISKVQHVSDRVCIKHISNEQLVYSLVQKLIRYEEPIGNWTIVASIELEERESESALEIAQVLYKYTRSEEPQ